MKKKKKRDQNIHIDKENFGDMIENNKQFNQ